MKKVWNILLFAFLLLCLFLLKPREDVVFAAINETQYIRLFEEGNDFELCVEEDDTYTGTYTIKNDTIILMYQEQTKLSASDLNSRRPYKTKNLPAKLFINKSASKIRSADNKSFSAQIYLDLRQKVYKPAPVRAKLLNSQTDKISATESLP